MKLKVLLPSKVLLEETVTRISAEAENGAFTLLPRHIDYVAALTPGLLSFVLPSDEEIFVAVDEGILVKCGDEVLVSVRNAVRGSDLGRLREAIEQEFYTLDDHEKRARSAALRIETEIIRQFIELKERF